MMWIGQTHLVKIVFSDTLAAETLGHSGRSGQLHNSGLMQQPDIKLEFVLLGDTPMFNPNPMNNYMSDTQIAELDERIRRMTTSLAQLQAQRRGAIKAKIAFAKFVRDIDRKDTP
jgi:hypothetical protein